MFLSIIIAVYNEEGNVIELTKRIYSAMDNLAIPFDLIYIIDGEDKSLFLLQLIQKEKTNLILNYSKKRRGFKNAFATGFSLMKKKTTHVMTLDADLNHQPEEFGTLLARMKKGDVDLVIGSRSIAGGEKKNLPLWKNCISIFANTIIKFIWDIPMKDKTSGFRLYKKEAIEHLMPLTTSENFEVLFEILMLAIKFNYKMDEVPIVFIGRTEGKSKFQLWKTTYGYIKLLGLHRDKGEKKPFIITKYVADRRMEVILKALKRLDKKKIKILDVGCGNQYITDKIRKGGYTVTALDKESPETSRWMKRKPDVIMDATHMDFMDNTFDVVVALEVIEHSPCLNEIKRVLKPGGLFLCSTPAPGTDWIRRILVYLRLLEDQDFEHHDHLVDLREIPMELLHYKKMFLGTSQMGILQKKGDT